MRRLFVLFFILGLILSFSCLGMAEAPKYDLGGETITFSSYFGWDDYEDGAGKARLEEVEEMFNVNIELINVHYSETADMIETEVLAGDVPFHVGLWQNHWMLEWDLYDFLHDLNPVLEEEVFERFPDVGPMGREQQAMIGDSLYALNMPEAAPVQRVFWNKDLFDSEGLPNLYDLYDNDEWNWENFKQIALDATQDKDGDGEIDQWGIAGSGFVGHGIGFPYSNDAPLIKNEDGRLVYAGNEPGFVESLELWHELQEEGAIYEEAGVHEGSPLWLDGDVAMFIYYHTEGGTLSEIEDEFGVVPLPKGPRAEEYGAPTILMDCLVVPVTVDNPREVIEVALALFEYAEPYIDKEEYEEEYWNEYAVDEGYQDMKSIEIIKELNELATSDFTNHLGPGVAASTIMDEVLEGNKSPQAAMDEIADEIQSALDESYN
ncbi:MAG: ABC transporter substrate-binding protein [Bacillota bacterium]